MGFCKLPRDLRRVLKKLSRKCWAQASCLSLLGMKNRYGRMLQPMGIIGSLVLGVRPQVLGIPNAWNVRTKHCLNHYWWAC
jgi:hypothetical protein